MRETSSCVSSCVSHYLKNHFLMGALLHHISELEEGLKIYFSQYIVPCTYSTKS